jgi:coenzyme F420-reducing hydrogenase delta subunit
MSHDFKPLITIFHCVNALNDGLPVATSDDNWEVRSIKLPCSGKVDILYLTKAFETGADGVAIVTCGLGECRYVEGNLRVWKRAAAVERLLEEAGLGTGRLAVIAANEGGLETVVRELEAFSSRLKALPGRGLSPDIEITANPY